MDWHYSVDGKERTGPVSEDHLRAQIAAGALKPDSLVWNKALPAWQPLSSTALFEPAPAGDVHACIITGKTFPSSQMIKTDHGWVSAEGRDTYYQCLRENVPLPVAAGQTNARADGKRIVIPIKGAKLPLRCIKTNQTVTAKELRAKKLYWCPPLVFVAILLNILIVLILYFVLRKLVPVEIPISAAGRGVVRKHGFIALGLVLLGLGFIVVSIVEAMSGLFGVFLALGIILCLVGLIYASRKSGLLRVVKYKNGEAWLTGACPEYVAALPAYR